MKEVPSDDATQPYVCVESRERKLTLKVSVPAASGWRTLTDALVVNAASFEVLRSTVANLLLEEGVLCRPGEAITLSVYNSFAEDWLPLANLDDVRRQDSICVSLSGTGSELPDAKSGSGEEFAAGNERREPARNTSKYAIQLASLLCHNEHARVSAVQCGMPFKVPSQVGRLPCV